MASRTGNGPDRSGNDERSGMFTAASGRDWLILGVVIVVLAAMLATIVTALRHPAEKPAPVLAAEGCQVTVEGHTSALNYEQSYNASIIVGEAVRRGLPARAATIALVTAMQESDLHNIDYGDRDSLGLFQQRPSQGWGDKDQIMDPWYSSGQFYDHLVKVQGWETGNINDVAQEVQKSGFPDAYAQHEPDGRAWASALAGFSPAAVTCVDRSQTPATPAELTDFITTVWGSSVTTSTENNILTVQASNAATAHAVAQLALARSQAAGVTEVSAAGQRYVIDGKNHQSWQGADASAQASPSAEAPGPAVTTITLRTA